MMMILHKYMVISAGVCIKRTYSSILKSEEYDSVILVTSVTAQCFTDSGMLWCILPLSRNVHIALGHINNLITI